MQTGWSVLFELFEVSGPGSSEKFRLRKKGPSIAATGIKIEQKLLAHSHSYLELLDETAQPVTGKCSRVSTDMDGFTPASSRICTKRPTS